MPFRRVCVFSDPSPDAGPEHRELAASVGWLLADNGLTLVFPASASAAGAELADAVTGAGAPAICVATPATVDLMAALPGLSERRMAEDIEERNAVLAELSDGFLALPGGIASLEDLFAIWTWGGFHQKPCGLLNRADYYTGLLHTPNDALLDRYVRESQRGMLIADRDPAVLLRAMADFRPPETRRFQSFDDA
ncbi:MAG TPA: LOG family protein [Gemmatimonadales bacterium]|jgi:hypothetical protein|nr:LOG family protein [Gemmatimonadales bacterium]